MESDSSSSSSRRLFFFPSPSYASVSFYLAVLSTAFCGFFFVSNVLKKNHKGKKKSASSSSSYCASCGCSCPKPAEEDRMMLRDRQTTTGASMMEQLVPEITTHTLSYLDYPSLCRLSMTNSLMRKAANDDTAWKALFHKDFTLEQRSVTPPNGWKAYYAATRAVVNANAEFYNVIRERSLVAMRRIWLPADYVKCVHGNGELFTGYNAVMQSWQLAFDWGQGVAFQIRDVRARVLTDMAWVTMKTYIDMDSGPFHATNVYEYQNGQWYLVHHHSSVVLIDVEMDHQNVFG